METIADCVFCKIINKEIPSEIIAETEDLIVIQDISPKAETHYLIIPKKHIRTLASFEPQDFYLYSKMLEMARTISKEKDINNFKLVINNGVQAGQVIFHIHMHFLAGKISDLV